MSANFWRPWLDSYVCGLTTKKSLEQKMRVQLDKLKCEIRQGHFVYVFCALKIIEHVRFNSHLTVFFARFRRFGTIGEHRGRGEAFYPPPSPLKNAPQARTFWGFRAKIKGFSSIFLDFFPIFPDFRGNFGKFYHRPLPEGTPPLRKFPVLRYVWDLKIV